MTKTAIATLLGFATLFATGCGVQPIGTVGKLKTRSVKELQLVSDRAGTIEMSVKGLGGYKTLATTQDIETVVVTLYAKPPQHGGLDRQLLSQPLPPKGMQQVTLTRKQLGSPRTNVAFYQVTPGQASLSVQAYDKQYRLIGSGDMKAWVTAGQTTHVGMVIRLQGQPTTGTVKAELTFEDDLVGHGKTAEASATGEIVASN